MRHTFRYLAATPPPPGGEVTLSAADSHHLTRVVRRGPGDAVELIVDNARRTRRRANHSVTQLLHQALRRKLGDHVTQKGSLVAPDKMRFDFSHPKPMTPDEIRAVEADVNRRIRGNGAEHVIINV